MKIKYHLLSALLAGPIGLAAASSVPANEIFLNIPGVTGPVTQPGYVGDISVIEYSQEFTNSSTINPGGGAGKTQCGAVNFTKLIDSTSIILLQHVVRGSVIPTLTLYFLGSPTGPGTTPAPYTIVLSSVVVTSISQGDSSNQSTGVGITERISLIAAKFAFTYRPLNGGILGPPETTGWNCLTNSPF